MPVDLGAIQESASEAIEVLLTLPEKLDLPTTVEFRIAGGEALHDVSRAIQSCSFLCFLICRPLAQLSWIVSQYLWVFLRFLGRHLFQKGLVSLQKGYEQAKYGLMWFLRFQKKLTRKQKLLELGFVALCFVLYRLRKHVQQQQYYERFMKWYQQQKLRVHQKYQRTVHRVAQVSLVLAMSLPHLLFATLAISLRLLLPSVVRWVARDTYAIAILSWWYPVVSTLFLLHRLRNPRLHANKANTAVPETPTRSTTGVFPRTTPRMTPSRSIQKWLRKPDYLSEFQLRQEVNFWLQYWIVYSITQALVRVCYLIPIFGRLLTKTDLIITATIELRLLFFSWIFLLSTLQSEKTDKDLKGSYENARPLRLILRCVSPGLKAVYDKISEAVPVSTWNMIVDKTKTILSVFVMMKLMTEGFQEWLIHVMEESRRFLVPSVTLFMPGFVTEFGTVYAQYLVPCAKSIEPAARKRLFLEYWMLNTLLHGLLHWWESILWWIPFSTHITYLLWCHLSFPKTIERWYDILEQELEAFGLLPQSERRAALGVHETRTMWLFKFLAKQLPAASDCSPEATTGSDGSTMNLESYKTPQTKKVVADDECADNQSHTEYSEEPYSEEPLDAPEDELDVPENVENTPVNNHEPALRRSTRLKKKATN